MDSDSNKTPLLVLRTLKKMYGKNLVLDVGHLEVYEHEAIGLVGNNGAGKTTMLSLILDLIQATEGYVTSKSQKVACSDGWKTYTTSYLNEGFLIPFLTPIEFLEFVGSLHEIPRADIINFFEENEDFFNPREHGNKYIRDLSVGNKNKVGILAALLPKPEILLLDEPFANLDPSSQSYLIQKLKQLQENGTTMIVSSHDLSHVTKVCNRVILLETGKVIKDIPKNEETLGELERYFRL